jgi:polyvinyl alcohol dehydrogenase (cytochrome)
VKLRTSSPLLFLLVPLAPLSLGCSSNTPPPPGQASSEVQTLTGPAGTFDCPEACADWPMYGQNVCDTRSASAAGPISPQTASRLTVKWTFAAAGDISATPAIVGDDIYVPDWGGMLNRIDARTGKAIWSKSVGTLLGLNSDAAAAPAPPPPVDGGVVDTPAAVAARDTPLVLPDRVVFGAVRGSSSAQQSFAILASVDPRTGALQWQTTLDPHPAAVITASPIYDNGVLYVGVSSGEEAFTLIPGYPCCSFRGSVVALDAGTGRILWKTYTIEDSAYFQSDGKTPSGYSGAAVWSGAPALDRKRRSLYIATGNNYSAPPVAGDAGPAPLPPGDHIESILSLDVDTGAIKWSQRMTTGDVWNLGAFYADPTAVGPDWDFGSGANLFRAVINHVPHDVIGAGQKSGVYWAVDPDNGSVLWKRQVGPGGSLGGVHWGTAVDSNHVYVPVNDELGLSYTLGGNGPQNGTDTSVGSWAALNPSNGDIEWQIANPAMTAPLGGTSVNGPVSAANGVLFAGSMDAQGTMFAIDGATGTVLWSFASGATVYGGPAIAGGVVYWGNGYPASRLGFGTPGGKLYAFSIGPAQR